MTRMVRKQINIEERQDELLKERARQSGRSESELIRKAIDRAYDPERVRAERDALFERWERGSLEAQRRILEAADPGPVWEGRDAIYRNARGTTKKHDA